jgi:hypothetical protein
LRPWFVCGHFLPPHSLARLRPRPARQDLGHGIPAGNVRQRTARHFE